jgi:3-dehydroquinate dehydratase-1
MNSNRGKSASGPYVAGVIVGGVRQATIKRALKAGAEVLELRIDTFAQRGPRDLIRHLERLKAVKKGGSTPLIITVRSRAEGGLYAIDDKKRLEIFKTLMPFADYVDIELSSGAILKDVVRSAKRAKTLVIVSYHNFKSTPGAAKLKAIIKKGRASGADIVKLATAAKRRADIKTLAGVLLEDPKLIVIAMGALGASTRVFFPMLGSLMTYGSLTKATAPGQLAVKEIKKQLEFYAPQRGYG